MNKNPHKMFKCIILADLVSDGKCRDKSRLGVEMNTISVIQQNGKDDRNLNGNIMVDYDISHEFVMR